MVVKWENNILGFIPQADWLSIDFNPTRPNDPADQLFGDLKTDNITAQWESIAAANQIPVMAQFHSFDVETQTTTRVPVDTHNIEKGLIKVKINQSERMRAILRAGVQNESLYDYVINDGVNLADQVITRTKVAKNELLATGKVTIKENNLDLTVDYGVPAAQTAYSIDVGQGQDIDAQIQAIIDDATNVGVVINGMVCSRKVLTKMRKNDVLQTAINGNAGAGGECSGLTGNADRGGNPRIDRSGEQEGGLHARDPEGRHAQLGRLPGGFLRGELPGDRETNQRNRGNDPTLME